MSATPGGGRKRSTNTGLTRRIPTFAKLRQELGKYNIDPAVLEKIISTLEF